MFNKRVLTSKVKVVVCVFQEQTEGVPLYDCLAVGSRQSRHLLVSRSRKGHLNWDAVPR
jgi:hypothetical protein